MMIIILNNCRFLTLQSSYLDAYESTKLGISPKMNVSVMSTGSVSFPMIGGVHLLPEIIHSPATPLPEMESDLTSLTSTSTATPPQKQDLVLIPSIAPAVPTTLPDYVQVRVDGTK